MSPPSVFGLLVAACLCHNVWAAHFPPPPPGHDGQHHGRLSPEYKWVFEYPLPIPPVKQEKWPDKPIHNPVTGKKVKYYEVDITGFDQQIYPDRAPTPMIGYDGLYPCPAFLEEKGVESVVRFTNHGRLASAAHLHGSYSRAPFDGWAEDLIKPGHYKDYFYPNLQSARMVWYHDHAIAHTAENAYFGQVGPYIIHDPAEDALGLPSGYGKHDIPLILNSKQYNSDGSLYSPANERDNLYGDVIDVNGQPWPHFEVEPRRYRLRLLNAAVSRSFMLHLEVDDDDGDGDAPEFDVIASDAGLLGGPVRTSDLFVSMGERYEIVVDFAHWRGRNMTLRNALGGMPFAADSSSPVKVDAQPDYQHTDKIMRFVVGHRPVPDPSRVPSRLRSVPWPMSDSSGISSSGGGGWGGPGGGGSGGPGGGGPGGPGGPGGSGGGGTDHHFVFEHTGGRWRINGVTFDEAASRILAKPQRGLVETWQLENRARGSSHPVHLHLVDFRVLSRTGGRGGEPGGGRGGGGKGGGGKGGGGRGIGPREVGGDGLRAYESAGLKDVVWLGPGETVTLEAHYAPWPGVYMFHCHNLIHEDHMMMAAFNVSVLQNLGYDQSSYLDPMDPSWGPRLAVPADYTYGAVKKRMQFMCGDQPYGGGSSSKKEAHGE